MADLLLKNHAPDGPGLVHRVTPESARWGHVGFELYRLKPGQGLEAATGGREACLVLVGGKARVRAGNQRSTTVSFWGAAATEARDPVLNFFIERYTPAYHAEIDHFVDCVERGTAPLVGYRDGREALRLADAALDSMRTGQTIRLD